MISAFDIGINLNIVLGGLERIQQLAAEFTKLQTMANTVAQEMERMGGTLGNTFSSATTASTSFEDALERNLTTMRAMRAESVSIRESMMGMGAMGGGPRRPRRGEEGGEGFGGGFVPFTARMVGGLAAIEVAQRGFEQMRTFDARLSALRQSGYNQRQIDELLSRADQARVPGMNLRDRTFLGQEVGSILGREGATSEAIRTLGTVSKSVSDLTAHGTPVENLRYVTRSAYLLGGIDDPRKGGLSQSLLNRNAMAIQNMIAASGGAVTAEQYFHNLQTAAPALRGTDFSTNTEKQSIFALFSDQMGKNAGHAFKELDLSIRSGSLVNNARTRAVLQEAGLVQQVMQPVPDRDTGRTQYIQTQRLRRGQEEGIALAPAIFEALRNDLRRRGQPATDDRVINLLKAAGVNATALQGFTAIGGPTGRDELARIREQFNSMPKSADQLAASMTDLNTALKDVGAAFDDMVAKMGVLGPLSSHLSAGLHKVADVMRAIGNFSQTDLGKHLVSVGTDIFELVGKILLLRVALGGIVRMLQFIPSVPGVPRPLAPVPGSFAGGALGEAGAGAFAGGAIAGMARGAFSGMMMRGLTAAFIEPILQELNKEFSPQALQSQISGYISSGAIGFAIGKIPGMIIAALLEATKREENAASIMEVLRNFWSDYTNGLGNLFKSPADRMNVEKMRPQNPENYGDPTNDTRVPATRILPETTVTAPRIRDTVPRSPIPRPTPMGPTGSWDMNRPAAGARVPFFNMDLTHPFGPPRPIGSGPLTTAPVVNHPQISSQVPRINTSSMAVTTMHVGSMTGAGVPTQGGTPLAPPNPVPTAPSAVPTSPSLAPVSPAASPSAPAGQSLASAMHVPQSAAYAYKNAVASIEHARYDQMGGAGGRYAGRYQMGPNEIRETAQRLHVPVPTQQQFLHDPAMQERFFDAYTASHYQQLMRNPQFAAMSSEQKLETLGYAHNQGVGGANRYINTGQVGRDAFNTPGTAYSDAIGKNLRGVDIDTPSVSMPRQQTSYHSQVDVHLDDERIASHMFNHMFDFNPSGNAGITGYDTNMSPWSPGTNIPR